MTVIASIANARVKQVRALRQRRERERSGLCYVEGIRAVGEAVQMDAMIELLVVAPESVTSDFGRSLAAEAAARGVPVLEVTPQVFRSLSDREGPQGLAAVVRQRWDALEGIRLDAGDTWLAIDSIGDPGNLGAVLRTCDAAGAAGVLLLHDSTDPYDSASIRASMGAVFAVRLARAAWGPFVDWTRAAGARLVGTSARDGELYRRTDYGERTVLLLGSEREGLSPEQHRACDALATIPMFGRASSLNLAVAAGVLLYEVVERREVVR